MLSLEMRNITSVMWSRYKCTNSQTQDYSRPVYDEGEDPLGDLTCWRQSIQENWGYHIYIYIYVHHIATNLLFRHQCKLYNTYVFMEQCPEGLKSHPRPRAWRLKEKKRWGAVVEETYIYIHSMELEKANDKPNQRLLQHNITTAITRRTHRGMFTPLLRWRWRGGRRPCCGFLKYHIRAKITRR